MAEFNTRGATYSFFSGKCFEVLFNLICLVNVTLCGLVHEVEAINDIVVIYLFCKIKSVCIEIVMCDLVHGVDTVFYNR